MALLPTVHGSLAKRVVEDPLTEETHRRKRALALTACLAVVVASYDITAKIPGLDLETKAPYVAQGALCVGLVYLLLAFCWNAWEDIRRWYASGAMLYLDSYFNTMLEIANYIRGIESTITRGHTVSNLEQVVDNAKKFLDTLDEAIKKAQSAHARLSILQWGKLAVVETGLPVALGLWGIAKTAPQVGQFVAGLFGASS